MVGAPDLLGKITALHTSVTRWLSAVLDPITAPLKALERDFANTIVEKATGSTLDEWTSYLTSPQTFINSPAIGFAANNQQQVDALMGLNPDGTFNPGTFAAMGNTINRARLILLNGTGLTSLLQDQSAGGYYLPDATGYPQ